MTTRCSRLATLALLALVALAVNPSTMAAKSPVWSETHAESVLVAKLRLPCANIRSDGCSVADAQQQVTEAASRLAACKAMDPARAIGCITYQKWPDVDKNLGFVQHGFPLASADCVGAGTPDASGYRFSQFRCKVEVDDDYGQTRPAAVTGRIMVYVTGPATFRWKVI